MEYKQKFREILGFINDKQQILIIVLTPLIGMIVPLAIQTKSANCAFVVILMSVYWLTEAIPIGVTSLFPVVFFPLMGIMPSDKVTIGYFKDILMLFFGGLVVANTIEITGLHERIALKVLLYFGSNPKWLMLGFMCITAFLSLWINNMATVSMMLPVIEAVVEQLVLYDGVNLESTLNNIQNIASSSMTVDTMVDMPMAETNFGINERVNQMAESVDSLDELSDIPKKVEKTKEQKEKSKKLASGFLLACAYAASIGGLGSLVGTAPNILIKGYYDRFYPEAKLNFLSFLIFALPVSIVMLIASWIWLSIRWLPKEYLCFYKKTDKKGSGPDALTVVLRDKYEELGPMPWKQKCISVIFIILVTLWMTRDLHAAPGWGSLFRTKFVTDTTPAIIAVILIFCCPKENIFQGAPYQHLIDWKTLQCTFPWSIFLLLGGGLAMATGFQESGLSDWVGEQLKVLASGRKEVTLAILIIISASATEFTSNTSMASIFIPIVDTLARENGVNPTYLLLPMILSVSLAFMLPIATPHNAIIFASGHLKIKDMVTTGFLMNIIGFLSIFIAANTWLGFIFDMKLTTTNVPGNFTLLNSTSF